MNITDALGTSLAHVGDFIKTPGGDLQTISGLDNLKNALFHRLLTVPGTLVHRPSYGVGIKQYQNNLNSFTMQQQLAHDIQEQFEQDSRVEEVTSVAVQPDDSNPFLVNIKIQVKVVGYSEVTLNYQPFSGGV